MSTSQSHAVIAIHSISRSGSSLLNILLDSIDRVTGPGELINLYQNLPEGRVPCVLCHPRNCAFYRSIKKHNFYADLIRLYDCQVLVDSSRVARYYDKCAGEYAGCVVNVVLYKRPHEYLSTWKLAGAKEVFREWASKYRHLPEKSFPLEYRTLVTRVDESLREIAVLAGLTAYARRRQWWSTRTHVVGVNEAIQHQINRTIRPNIDPKYRGREEQIFRDEHWRSNGQFKREMLSLYQRDAFNISESLGNLGMSIEEQISDLLGPVAESRAHERT